MSERSSNTFSYQTGEQSSGQQGSDIKGECVPGIINEKTSSATVQFHGDHSSDEHPPENDQEQLVDNSHLNIEVHPESPKPKKSWRRIVVLLITSTVLGALLSAIPLIIVGVNTHSKQTSNAITPSVTEETVLIGTVILGWFKAVTITTNNDLGYQQVNIWLAEKVVTYTQTWNVSASLNNDTGFTHLYVYQSTTFCFEFFSVTGPPGYSIELHIFESSNASNVVCRLRFGDVDREHLVYPCAINQTGYYDIDYVVSNGVSGTVVQYFELVKLNHTFYSSSSNPSCVLDNSNHTCTLPRPTSKLPMVGKQYIIAFIPPNLAPQFQIQPKGRIELFSIGVVMFLLVVFVSIMVALCYICKK